MTDNDNQKTDHTSTGIFVGKINGADCCKCCKADLTGVNPVEHMCELRALFNTTMQYRQMLEDICNNTCDFNSNDGESLIDSATVNLAREVLGWEKV